MQLWLARMAARESLADVDVGMGVFAGPRLSAAFSEAYDGKAGRTAQPMHDCVVVGSGMPAVGSGFTMECLQATACRELGYSRL